MRIVKNILAGVFALWAMITFIITFLIFYIPSMTTWLIPEPAGQRVFINIARLWMRIWLPIAGCSIRIKGKENFKKGETYVVTCNHNSFMDIPLSCPFIPGPNKTIAKKSFTRVPLFGFYYMKGSVIVDRNNEKSRKESVQKMKKVIANHMHMSIYPEGTRNRTSEPLKKFYDGAFRLSVDTGASVIPAVIFNTKRVLPPGKGFYFWPGRIEMHFLAPVSSAGLTVTELRDKVFEIMKDYYTRNIKN
ncbi:MAG: 1-acyl-sn-glycerol-3-phosphate acyltransferase [Chitinophagales bacterium]|nr:1-acyl-sn-glycerol-3-phosphate acyltransferase [Chitinophagales bacterium]